MNKEIEIPKGHKARIDGDKIIIEPRESEDDRIRKTLTHIVKSACDKYGIKYKGDNITEEKLLAYLERQKDANKEYWRGYREGKQEILDKYAEIEKQKEVKPHYTYEESKQAAEDCYYNEGYNNEDGGRCHQQSFLWGFEEGVNWCEKQKGQQPLSTEETELNSLAFLEQIGYTCIPPGKEHGPAEWSEEDETCLEYALWCITKTRHFVAKDACDLDACRYAERWLKNLPERFNLQPKQEWSEEDKLHLNNAILAAEKEWGADSCTVKFLKSFCPPFKDREMKLKILKYLSTRCSSLEFEEVENYLNNLQSSWRPSEEQMEALRKYSSYWRGMTKELPGIRELETLYADLQKLL